MQKNLKGLLVLFIILLITLINLRETNRNIWTFLFWEILSWFIYKQVRITKFLKVATVYVRKQKTFALRSALCSFCRALLWGVTQGVPILMPDFNIKKNHVKNLFLTEYVFLRFLKQLLFCSYFPKKNLYALNKPSVSTVLLVEIINMYTCLKFHNFNIVRTFLII